MNCDTPIQQHPLSKWRRRATWLGLVGGIVVKFGSCVVLVGMVIFGGRIRAASTDAPRSSTEHMDNIDSGSWLVLQAINLVGAALAGWVSSWLASARSLLAPSIVVGLALASSFFAQLPAFRSPWLLSIWAIGAPIGVAIGAAIHRRHEHEA